MKICLIGNNLTSLILAYILSKRNFYVEICYLNSTKSNYKTRTLGITDFNLNYLKRYFHKISKVTNPITDIKVLIQNGKINNEIDFNKIQRHYLTWSNTRVNFLYKIKNIKK